MTIAYYIIVLIIVAMLAYVAYATFCEMIERQNEEERDDLNYYRNKKIRQERIDRHEKALARRCLVEVWAKEFPNRK